MSHCNFEIFLHIQTLLIGLILHFIEKNKYSICIKPCVADITIMPL